MLRGKAAASAMALKAAAEKRPTLQHSSADLVGRLIRRKATFAALYSAPQMVRIHIVKSGLPSGFVTVLVSDLGMSKERFYSMAGVARATIDKKVKDNRVLDRAESESVLAIAQLIGQVEHMVQTSGDPEGFNAPHWVSEWLQSPLPALGGHAPFEYMDTAEGRSLISGLIAQMQSGVYA